MDDDDDCSTDLNSHMRENLYKTIHQVESSVRLLKRILVCCIILLLIGALFILTHTNSPALTESLPDEVNYSVDNTQFEASSRPSAKRINEKMAVEDKSSHQSTPIKLP